MIQERFAVTTNLVLDENPMEAAEGGLESGRAGGATMRGLFSSLIAAILVSGCAAAYAPAPLPVTHPANPAAPEAPPPPPSQAFRSENVLPTPAEEEPVQGPHTGHGAMHGGCR